MTNVIHIYTLKLIISAYIAKTKKNIYLRNKVEGLEAILLRTSFIVGLHKLNTIISICFKATLE